MLTAKYVVLSKNERVQVFVNPTKKQLKKCKKNNWTVNSSFNGKYAQKFLQQKLRNLLINSLRKKNKLKKNVQK
jgi:pyridoxine 5'-phosphate synthase PdxJ